MEARTPRIPIPKRIRFEVFKRDSFKCQYCGGAAPEVVLHIDHIKPVSAGGQNDIVNLITSCEACNLGKAAVPLSDTSAAMKSRRQMEALQERREQLEMIMEWQQGIEEIECDAIVYAANTWRDCFDGQYYLNESGVKEMGKLISTYGLREVLSVISQATKSIGQIDDASVETAWNQVKKICKVRKECGGDELKIEARRFRGLLRHILDGRYIDYRESLWYITQALETDIPRSEVKAAIVDSSSYTDFTKRITKLIEMWER